MSITKEQMQELIYDPSIVQKTILDMLSNNISKDTVVSDPTNPFVLLLEASAMMASASVIESNNVIRKKYPSLADKSTDIYHHLTDDMMNQIYGYPAETTLDMHISKIDLFNMGYRPDGANYKQTTIPAGSVVKVDDVDLTILNDIIIRLYDNDEVYVEQQQNPTNSFAYNDVGSINSTLYHSSEGTPWILFRIKVKQVSVHSINKLIIKSDSFKQVVTIPDIFCYAKVSYKNEYTGGSYASIPTALNDEYIDPTTPTAYINVYNKDIVVKIPDVYILEERVSGNVQIDIYSTKGEVNLPLDRFKTTDFSITLNNTGKNKSSASIKNITIMVNSYSKLEGGKNSKTLDELKEMVINNSGITNSLPITIKQLEGYLDVNGYKLVNNLDVLTKREFIALRSLKNIESDNIFFKADIFFNSVEIDLTRLINHDRVVTSEDGKYLIIKSNTIFKEENGKVVILPISDVMWLERMLANSRIQLFNHLEENKYFFNPYYYIIRNEGNYNYVNVYDLDKPVVSNARIAMKNLNQDIRVNINKYAILKNDKGYSLYLTLAPNSEFEELDPTSIRLQMKIPLFNTESYAYIDAEYDSIRQAYVFNIETDMVIDADERLTLTNGVSPDLPTKKFSLTEDVIIYTMSSDTTVEDDTKFLNNEIYNITGVNYTIFTKEILTLEFGCKLEHIYTNLYNIYTDKKYKTYEEDIPERYKENVYRLNENGSPFTCNKDEYNHNIAYDIVHRKNDIVLDENGEQVLKHKKGEVILDEKGQPILDQKSGMVRYLEILLLEFELLVSDSVEYMNYKEEVLISLKSYIRDDMDSINQKLLENSKVYYKSFKTAKPIEIISNNIVSTIPYIVTPNVTLYIKDTTNLSVAAINNYKTIIAGVINKHIDKKQIVLEDIKTDIKNSLGSYVSGIKIENMDPSNSEVITFKNDNVRMVINKKLENNENNNIITRFNIKLNIIYI